MLEAVTGGVDVVIGWVGTVVNSFNQTDGELKDLLAFLGISVGVSALMLGIKAIRSMIWGA